MEYNFEDVAHLYAGCEILDDYDGKLLYLYYPITADSGPDNVMLKTTSGFLHSRKWNEVKPILRLIADMTEDEAREFFGDVMNLKTQFALNYTTNWWKNEHGFISILDCRRHGNNQEWYVVIKPSGNPNIPCFNCTYTMAETAWLLKRGFDLFGLIAAGKAHNKATFKHE